MANIFVRFPEGKHKCLTFSYDGWRLPKEKIKELYRGHEIAIHGYEHPYGL